MNSTNLILITAILFISAWLFLNVNSYSEEKGNLPEGVMGLTKQEWKEKLTPLEYKVLWEKGTERPFTGELLKNKKKGVYVTKGCKQPVFSSEHKFESGTGWPSFWKPISEDAIKIVPDNSWGMKRYEVVSSECGEHLGHVFKDGPEPTGLRYCINSVSLEFVEDKKEN